MLDIYTANNFTSTKFVLEEHSHNLGDSHKDIQHSAVLHKYWITTNVKWTMVHLYTAFEKNEIELYQITRNLQLAECQ
jgi:hypothetical protein